MNFGVQKPVSCLQNVVLVVRVVLLLGGSTRILTQRYCLRQSKHFTANKGAPTPRISRWAQSCVLMWHILFKVRRCNGCLNAMSCGLNFSSELLDWWISRVIAKWINYDLSFEVCLFVRLPEFFIFSLDRFLSNLVWRLSSELPVGKFYFCRTVSLQSLFHVNRIYIFKT